MTHRMNRDEIYVIVIQLVLADQTPTPTRLIRNCEEVGLFDDLQHVNPFDETFRRAVESDCGDHDVTKCTKPNLETQTTLEALTMHSEETLHTPNVLPYTESTSVSTKRLKSTISFDDEMLQPIGHTVAKLETMQEVGASQMADASNSKGNTPQVLVKNEVEAKNILLISSATTPYLISMQPTPDPSTIGRPLAKLIPKKVPVVEHPIKEKLKQLILHARGTSTTTTTSVPEANVVVNPRSIVNEKVKTDKRCKSEKSTSNSELFERNRAAAQRYRMKVKKNQTFLRQRNAELEAENERLRTELKSMKTILLSHQDCSVTRALNERIINLQTHFTIQNESKSSIFYLVDDSKSKNGNSGKS